MPEPSARPFEDADAWIHSLDLDPGARAVFEHLKRHEPKESQGWQSAVAAVLLAERGKGNTAQDLSRPLARADGGSTTLPAVAWAHLKTPAETAPWRWLRSGRAALWGDWHSEQVVAQGLVARLRAPRAAPAPESFQALFRQLFPQCDHPAGDRQALAALCALHSPLVCVTGGPGTGKTTTVVRLLALLFAENPALRVALAAPTGKAAARLSQSVSHQRGSLPISHAERRRITAETMTLHRLLGRRPGSPETRYDAGRLLPYDLVIVDEMSMVDHVMAAALLRAMPKTSRLILIGDPEQLDPVAPGRFFADLVGLLPREVPEAVAHAWRSLSVVDLPGGLSVGEGPLAGVLVELQRTFRFASAGSIGRLAEAVRQSDAALLVEALSSGREGRGLWPDTPGPELLVDKLRAVRNEAAQAKSPARALEATGRFQLLCAQRVGPFGTEALGGLIDRRLAAERPSLVGVPIMILRNAPLIGLANGDLGVGWSEGRDRPVALWFPGEGELCSAHSPYELPPHERAYALTVHKSQGSEFDEVWLVLGDDPERAPARSLLYTAITRARQKVQIFGSVAVLEASLLKEARVETGFAEALQEALATAHI